MKRRKTLRIAEFDYGAPGAYFVTIVTHRRETLFGAMDADEIKLNLTGMLAKEKWEEIPAHFRQVALDAFIVMPNHVHGILFIQEPTSMAVGAQHAAPLHAVRPQIKLGSLGAIIRSYKSAVTKSINELRNTPGSPVWQRNYYEHIIRDERDLDEIRDYIMNNAATWPADAEYPA